MNEKRFIALKDLKVYQPARELSSKAWDVYCNLTFEHKKIMGDQFIRSMDSIGANIAEGHGRFPAMDQVKFYLYSRRSMLEAHSHWTSLLFERKINSEADFGYINTHSKGLQVRLNNFISSTRKSIKK
ncbi:MAG: four helix bundle protein [Bacteroidales bacterium]|jgi:four helix bundle protein